MKKSLLLFLLLALVAGGAFCMSYSSDWKFDALGAVLMVAGGVLGTIVTVKSTQKMMRILLLCLLYLAIVLLLIAGWILFEGTILLAIMGAAAFAVFGYLLYKQRE